ncbi:MAG: DNA repair protein RadA [Oscillospiraceae bacterium]|nr:DNA repair protein RadA [Oscillospiraceae bacterium]
MAKAKTIFYCTACGNESPKWQGRCAACGAWNTLEEHIEKPNAIGKARSAPVGMSRSAQRLQEVETDDESRFSTGMGELDRVLGGGAVAGSLVLVGGAPGIGKSTLLLQICNKLCADRTVLYISGEESERQLKLRAVRLGVSPESLFVLSETRLSDIMEAAETVNPDILIVDSIQTLYNEENESSPGSVSQVKDCTMTLMHLSKARGITVFVVGHINKDGAIAGPKVLEHMVDCVLYFEGDPNTSYRLLRAAKNRFGSTNEIGVFEMLDTGLKEVPNPSQMLLAGRPEGAPGTCVACVMEGTRPVLAEVQALVTKTTFNVPRRTADGFDFNRAVLLMAVAEKRGGMKLNVFDAYINVIGGLRLDEPGADLSVVLAVASSYRDQVIPDDLVAIGEVGLTGEIRSVSNMNQRLSEVSRLGFQKCIIPRGGAEKLEIPDGLTVYRVRNIREAIETAL